MNQTHTPRTLAGPLRSRINRLAHSQALHHETLLKAALIEQLLKARQAGATFVQLNAMIDGLELG